MLKTSAKILLVFVLLVAVALVTGYVTYNLTGRVAEERPAETVKASVNEMKSEEQLIPLRSKEKTEEQGNSDEHYTVRLEGTTLGVYVINDGKEEFLYHADVYKNDLSDEDLRLLRKGVELKDMSELTGFIENFTS